ncbi:GNAT family N-acetyltransferase [Nostoc sp.]|uniref:GNAT family N-acetyltransferase n=1 Tax=Nostoc sp. TaxID=1180 RepID=UPI002FFCDB63
MKKAVEIVNASNNKIVNGDIETMSDSHLADFEIFWKPRLKATDQEDKHWDWIKKRNVTDVQPNYERYALVCERITQGLMLLEIDWHRSRLKPGKNLVYIDFLATAPWNRKLIEEAQSYKHIGGNLIAFAIERSFDLGYKGRIGLHSLSRAEEFYNRLKMTNFGEDIDKQKLKYFELSEEEARKIMASD